MPWQGPRRPLSPTEPVGLIPMVRARGPSMSRTVAVAKELSIELTVDTAAAKIPASSSPRNPAGMVSRMNIGNTLSGSISNTAWDGWCE